MSLTFDQQLLLTLIDKGLLALIFAIVGFWLNALLERQKAKAGLLQALAPTRAAAYTILWSKTEKLGFSNRALLSTTIRDGIFEELTKWYYEEGGAMYLSHGSAKQFMSARNQLKNYSVTDATLRDSFSSLRTQLKLDFGIYTEKEAKTSII